MTEWVFWLLYLLFVAGGAIIIFKMANTAVEEVSQIPSDLEDGMILIPRFYNSDYCFAYKGMVDGVYSIHSRIIDLNKFKQKKRLNESCYLESHTVCIP